jgi:carbonic anhydrase
VNRMMKWSARAGLAALCLGLLGGGAWAEGAAGLRPDDALARLKEGNARYVKGRLKHPNGAPKRRTEVAQKQKPFAIVLSCADSRVPPELVFDQGIGDLFVVRTAGQAIGDIEFASIEYAVEHLGASMIMVLGHERCGAVKATVETLHPPPIQTKAQRDVKAGGDEHGGGHGEDAHGGGGHDAPAHGEDAHGGGHDAPAHGEDAHGGGHDAPAHAAPAHGAPAHGAPAHGAPAHGGGHADEIDSGDMAPRDHIHLLVAQLIPAVKAAEAKGAGGDLLDAAVQENVRMLVARLVKESPLLKSFLVAGRIRIVGARYDLDSGEVKLVR